MTRGLCSRRTRLTAALLAASVTVFALAGAFHRHDAVERAAGATLAASKSAPPQLAAPCIACLAAHSVCAAPAVVASAAAPRDSFEVLRTAADRAVAAPQVDSGGSRAPPLASTNPALV